MKKLKQVLILILLFFTTGFVNYSCEDYDDSKIWEEITNIKADIDKIKTQLNDLQTLANAINERKYISNVEQTDEGYQLTFNNHENITIINGHNGTDGEDSPIIGIKEVDGVFYWTLTADGNTEFLMNGDQKLRVTAETPQITIDDGGCWTLNGAQITNSDDEPIRATPPEGIVLKNIEDLEGEVVLTLPDNSQIRIPKGGSSKFKFTEKAYHFYATETQTIHFNGDEIASIEILNHPADWTVKLDAEQKQLKVTAPETINDQNCKGNISLIGLDEEGNTLLATTAVDFLDYTDPKGTFVVAEGNMTTVNGTVHYYDRFGNEHLEIFEKANDNKEIGNVVQDMYIANNSIYYVTQNGDSKGGVGRFVVCDSRSMKLKYADPLIIKTPEDVLTWPQHIVVTSNSKAYVQYSDRSMEKTSGICVLHLTENGVTVGKTIDGTFGAFTTDGAIKTRMLFSRGKLYAGVGHSVVIIDPATDKVIKKIPFDGRQMKGIVKGADGNIYIALASPFTGGMYSPAYSSNPEIVCIDHDGKVLSETELEGVKFPVASWSPAVGMCASYNEPYLYFVDTDEFNANTLSRYNYETQQLDLHFLECDNNIYGIQGQHPFTHQLWICNSNYVSSDIYVYNIEGSQTHQIRHMRYGGQKGASPAGIDFGYRFSDEFINK